VSGHEHDAGAREALARVLARATSDLCPDCLRERAGDEDWAGYAPGEGEHLCWDSPGFCQTALTRNAEAIQADALLASPEFAALIARVREAEAERDRLAEREKWFALNIPVPDGGQYRGDWQGAVENLIRRVDEAEAEVAALRATVQRVREALSRHPRACDKHADDDAVTCGWRSAVADVATALDRGVR